MTWFIKGYEYVTSGHGECAENIVISDESGNRIIIPESYDRESQRVIAENVCAEMNDMDRNRYRK